MHHFKRAINATYYAASKNLQITESIYVTHFERYGHKCRKEHNNDQPKNATNKPSNQKKAKKQQEEAKWPSGSQSDILWLTWYPAVQSSLSAVLYLLVWRWGGKKKGTDCLVCTVNFGLHLPPPPPPPLPPTTHPYPPTPHPPPLPPTPSTPYTPPLPPTPYPPPPTSTPCAHMPVHSPLKTIVFIDSFT